MEFVLCWDGRTDRSYPIDCNDYQQHLCCQYYATTALKQKYATTILKQKYATTVLGAKSKLGCKVWMGLVAGCHQFLGHNQSDSPGSQQQSHSQGSHKQSDSPTQIGGWHWFLREDVIEKKTFSSGIARMRGRGSTHAQIFGPFFKKCIFVQ